MKKAGIRPPRDLVNALRRERSFVLLSHERPDGDSIGCQLALARALRKLGRRVAVVNPDPVPDRFRFLPGAEKIRAPGRLAFRPAAAVVLDSPLPRRLGPAVSLLEAASVSVNIDHHVSNLGFGDYNWVDNGLSSTGEMIYHLLPELGVALDRPLALCLYVALLTDMGKFQFMVNPSSGERVLRLAADLVSTGLVPYRIYKSVYNHSAEEMMLLRRVLKTLDFAASGRIAYLVLKRRVLQDLEAGESEIEGLVAYPRDIRGVLVALTFTEKKGAVKVSFRSKEPSRIDVNRIAAAFGGGGHPAAAGATVSGELPAVRARILKAVKKELDQAERSGKK